MAVACGGVFLIMSSIDGVPACYQMGILAGLYFMFWFCSAFYDHSRAFLYSSSHRAGGEKFAHTRTPAFGHRSAPPRLLFSPLFMPAPPGLFSFISCGLNRHGGRWAVYDILSIW